jgi:predicted DNA-binding transcriptional regulator AlpA
MIMDAQQTNDVSNGSDLLDEAKLAARLDLSRATLQNWRYAGKGPRYIKIGRLIRYRNPDVDAYLKAQTRGALTIVR